MARALTTAGWRFLSALLLGSAACAGALAMPLAGSAITNRAEAVYVPFGQVLPELLHSNTVTVKVAPVEALALSLDNTVSRPAGQPAALPHTLVNTGNVLSRYVFDLRNQPGDDFDLTALVLVHDINGNGRPDADEPRLAINGGAAALTLSPGESANLLVVGSVPLTAGSGGPATARLRLVATTSGTSPVTATVSDSVTTGRVAALVMEKHADQTGRVLPGTQVNYRITTTNIGDVPARATTHAGASVTAIQVDAVPVSALLLNDVIPPGTRYVPGSLVATLPGALRLFRLAGDLPYQYRTNADVGSVIEVAVALPNGVLNPNSSAGMGFGVVVTNDAAGTTVLNVGLSAFNDGSGPSNARSNQVQFQVPKQVIGVAQRASPPIYENDANSRLLGTARVRMTFVLENFGSDVARDVQLTNILAGSTSFGRYTTSTTPGPGEYTVLANSVAIRPLKNNASLAFNPAYSGDPAQANLLAAGVTLPPGSAVELGVDVRLNISGRDGRIFTSSLVTANFGSPGYLLATDNSVNGSVPDANGDGDPTNDTSPTSVTLSLPAIAVEKTSALPRRIEGNARRYEIDYTITVSNTGSATASYVHVADQLSCTFKDYLNPAPVKVWSLVGLPVFQYGRLNANPGYTGRAACNNPPALSGDPYKTRPRESAVQLTDGSRHLAPGQIEVIRYTVQLELEPLAKAGQKSFDNIAIASLQDSAAFNSSAVVVAAQAAAVAVPIDPSGVVYHAVTRAPVPGAMVTLSRFSCSTASEGAITSAQVVPSTGNPYQFNSDGTVSQITDAAGRYFFFLLSPPVLSTCEYRLTVVPPPGAGLLSPSRLLAPDPGIAPGGPVQVQGEPPSGSQATPYFLRFSLAPGLPDVWNNHVPLDPGPVSNSLLIQKSSNRPVVEIGQTVDYTVKIRNIAGQPLRGLELADQLPPGFRLVSGSTRLDGVATSEPAGAPGSNLLFSWPNLLIDTARELTVNYRAVAGIGTPLGRAINRVVARSSGSTSNESTASVRVEGGVFSEEAYVVGKVYLDCSRDGMQGHQEIGIPGVRLVLEDGTGVVTDVEGKFSFYGLRAITHVLKLDSTTLPPGAKLGYVGSRQGGRLDSRFVDLKKGELHKADFAVENCLEAGVLASVLERRKALANRPDGEGEAVVKARLSTEAAAALNLAEVRRRPALGEITPGGAVLPGNNAAATKPVQVFEPLLLENNNLRESHLAGQPKPVPARADLETLLLSASNEADFVDLPEQESAIQSVGMVRVKGRLGTTLRLTVNGRVETELRVGKRVKIADRDIEGWEYVGVQFRPGDNTLLLEEVDGFGIVRATRSRTLKVAGRIHKIEVELPQASPADAATRVPVRIRLKDEQGLPVLARTHLTLEASHGRWETDDLNPIEPGTQVVMEGGQAVFMLVPPNEPVDAQIRVSNGALTQEKRMPFLPELRPMIGAGLIEGVIDLRRRGLVPMGTGARDAFEQSLRNLSFGDGAGDGRVAFYFKGTVRGDYLLTAAFDSDKTTSERLFRDIQPDKYYPIYGDSAARLFDAQSSGRLYVRVDHQRSWLLYGDFTTADISSGGAGLDPRRLSQSNRSATGIKLHKETDRLSMNVFASQDNLSLVTVELPADGTSGPYLIPGVAQWRENGEQISVVVRDRNQPTVIIKTIPLARFTDYVIDPVSRRLLFVSPVASVDENLNPRAIRVQLETESGGPDFWFGGVDLQYKVNDRLQLGASVQSDQDPTNPNSLTGVTAVIRPGSDGMNKIIVEMARSDSLVNGVGNAARIEATRDDGPLAIRAQITATDSGFVNPSGGIGAGKTDASGSVQIKVDDLTTLKAETLFSTDTVAATRRTGTTMSVSRQLSDAITGELGTRISRDSAVVSGTQVDNDLFTLRGRLSWRPQATAQVYVEAEQDVRESEKRLLAVGGERQLGEKTRLYGRYEAISSLGSAFALNTAQQNNVAVLGIDSTHINDGRVFNEFRLRDSINGRDGQYATGIRKTWQAAPGLRVSGSAEHTTAFGGISGSRSSALTGGAEYSADERYRLSGSLEVRSADTSKSMLNALGLSYKLNKDWSLLARSTVSLQRTEVDQVRTVLARQQLGLAWREVDRGHWNALARYEHVLNEVDSGPAAEREQSHIVSTHVNYQPSRDWIWSGRYALKNTDHLQASVASNYWAQLVFGRVTLDLTRVWDLSVQGAYHWGKDGTARTALGVETGVRLGDNLWLSLGYNMVGLNDRTLAGNDYLESGVFFRLRYKFDEHLFK